MCASLWLSIGIAVLSTVCVYGRSTQLAATATNTIPSAAPAAPVVPAVKPPVETFDKPDSYFVGFNVSKAFAATTLVRVKDVERLQKNMLEQVDRKMDDVLAKNDPQKAGKQYLEKNEKCIEVEQKLTKAKATYNTKKEAYCAKEKKPEFKALEIAATTDSSKRIAFMTLLKKSDLKDEWDDVQELSKELTEVVKARNTAWAGLPVGIQNLVLVYQKKCGEINAAAAKKIAQLQKPAA